MKKIKSVECSCSLLFPKNLMIGKKCYLCVLQEWPLKIRNQRFNYEKAVGIRLGLNSPLTIPQGTALVRTVGLNNLGLLQNVIEGRVVSLKPADTFFQRLVDKLEKNNG